MTALDNIRVFKVVHVICPYCGFVFNSRIELRQSSNDLGEMIINSSFNPEVVTCPADEGGCDRWLAVRIHLDPKIERFELSEATDDHS